MNETPTNKRTGEKAPTIIDLAETKFKSFPDFLKEMEEQGLYRDCPHPPDERKDGVCMKCGKKVS